MKESFCDLLDSGKDFLIDLFWFIFAVLVFIFKPIILLVLFIRYKIKNKKKNVDNSI